MGTSSFSSTALIVAMVMRFPVFSCLVTSALIGVEFLPDPVIKHVATTVCAAAVMDGVAACDVLERMAVAIK